MAAAQALALVRLRAMRAGRQIARTVHDACWKMDCKDCLEVILCMRLYVMWHMHGSSPRSHTGECVHMVFVEHVRRKHVPKRASV